MFDPFCTGCGSPVEIPGSYACGHCPERDCSDCGARITGASELVNGGGPCDCWTDIQDIPHATLKGLFAADGFNYNTDGTLTL